MSEVDGKGWFTVRNVAVLDEHEQPGDGGPAVRFDSRDLREIADNSQKRIEDTGDFCPVTIGHTPNRRDPNSANASQPPIVGYAKNFRMGTIGKLRPRAAIFTDMVFPEKLRDSIRQFPRRSIELWPKSKVIDPIALLGGETPMRDLGLMSYSRAGSDEQSIRYSINENISDQDQEVASPMYDKEMVQEIVNAVSATPWATWAKKKMAEETMAAAIAPEPEIADPDAEGSPMDGDGDEMGAGVGAEDGYPGEGEGEGLDLGSDANGNETPLAGDAAGAAETDMADEYELEKTKMSRDKYREASLAANESLAKVTAERNQYAKKFQRVRREMRLADLEKEGLRFSRAEVLKTTDGMSDKDFNGFVDNVLTPNFKRGPIGRQLSTVPISDGGEDFESRPLDQEQYEKAMTMSKSGKAWEDCIRLVKGLPV